MAGFGGTAEPPARRDNGLRADQFVALADVDPRLGDHLLDLLRLAEIPAYLEPPTDPRVSVRYRVSGPVERLYVRADQRSEARAVVVAAAHEAGESTATVDPLATPDVDPPSVDSRSSRRSARPTRPDVLAGMDTDAEFARIVAGFSTTSITPAIPATPRRGAAADTDSTADPAETDPTADAGPTADSRPTADAGPTADPTETDPADGDGIINEVVQPVNRHGIDPTDLVGDPFAGTPVTPADLDAAAAAAARMRGAAERQVEHVDDDADDHFHPPPAPPFPVPSANTVGAIALLVFGLLVLARGDLFGLDSTTSFPASIILLLGGSALLVRGLRDEPEDGDERDDDGAEV